MRGDFWNRTAPGEIAQGIRQESARRAPADALSKQRLLPDLHRHLDGSLRETTFRELAARRGLSLPLDLRFRRGMGLDEALARFQLTLAVLDTPEAVRRVAGEICDDAAQEGVSTLELRFAPQLHPGGPMEAIVDAALEGLEGRAGLILCALYGDPPGLVEQFLELSRNRPEVVGIDLAGGPSRAQRFRLEDYGPAFRRARALGLGTTVHAGEGRPPQEIRTAILELAAARIGHGTTLSQDPEVLELVVEHGVVVETCLTSNLQTGAIPAIEAHPLATWLAAGVRACVCTDNTFFSDVTAASEHERAAALPGVGARGLERLIRTGHEGAFPRRR